MKLIKFLPVLLLLGFLFKPVYATNCIETGTCMPVNVPDVLNLYDVWYGSGMTIMAMALIIGIITVAVYVRNRSLPMLTVLGIYEIAAFGSILTSSYVASQYQFMQYVLIMGAATGVVMLVLRLVKE